MTFDELIIIPAKYRNKYSYTGYGSNIEYTCLLCDQTINSLGQIEDHLIQNHPEDCYRCTHCNECFVSRFRFKRHLKKVDNKYSCEKITVS